MTILRVMSDIHLDWHKDLGEAWLADLPHAKADAVIVAGDVANAKQLKASLTLLCERFKDSTVYFVPGNHDFWGGAELARQTMDYAEMFIKNLRCVDRDVFCLDQLGKSPKNPRWLAGAVGFPSVTEVLPADRQIAGPATAAFFQDESEKDWHHLAQATSQIGAEVIVTHYLPHKRSIHPKYENYDNSCFLNDYLGVMLGHPKLWIHGHTHESCDYVEQGTRVVCNPYGYYGYEVNEKWDPCLLIEV